MIKLTGAYMGRYGWAAYNSLDNSIYSLFGITLHWSLERSGRVEIVNRTQVLPIKWTSADFHQPFAEKGCVSVGTSLELFSLHLSFSISVVMFRCRCVAVDFISMFGTRCEFQFVWRTTMACLIWRSSPSQNYV